LTDKISDKDKIDWENFLLSKDKLPNKDFKIKNQKYFKTRSLDLHGFSLDRANKLIEKFIINSYQEKVDKLIIVTGKGLHSDNDKDPFVSKDLSILKYSVPEFIEGNKDLMSKINEIKDADIKDGGSGAFYIYLKKQK
jgi:DNA-nicking Smr family endonuclease